MDRQILFLRQGSSQFVVTTGEPGNFAPQGEKQYAKELSDKGKRRAQRMGVWIAQKAWQPDFILCSPSPVAQVTAEKTAKAMGLGSRRIVSSLPLKKLSPADWNNLLVKIPSQKQCVMMVAGKSVGESLFNHLISSDLAQDITMKPASLAVFSCSSSWQKITAHSLQLREIKHAKGLPKGFPFPDINGREQRIRPAYYYQQSSVIPYRIEQGKVEILLVSSSKKKHWVVPKGIHEPGLTATASAEKEAYEEAGVEGLVDNEPIGHYEYEKWEGVCQVVVFPMQVQRVINESDWEEAHRGRLWAAPDVAARLVRQTALALFILGLAKQVRPL